jgi:alpha-beta hydrolase superfamily lysophospholipase
MVLLHGADDQVVPPEVSRSYVDRVRASARTHAEVRRTVIPACEHFALIDPEHPAFAMVLDSVRSLAP